MQEEVCGILVDVKEYREHDALLKVLCEDGSLLSLSARGVRKVTSKNAPAVQLFTLARLQLNYQQTASIQSLRRAEIINSYRKIREDLVKQSIASYFCECIYRSGFEENVYILLKQSLDILQDAKHPLQILCLFQAVMNRMHGIEPFVDGCVRCQSTQHIQAVSRRDGGFICKSCLRYGDHVIPRRDLKTFRLLCKAELEHYELIERLEPFSSENFEELYGFFEDYGGIALKVCVFFEPCSLWRGTCKLHALPAAAVPAYRL